MITPGKTTLSASAYEDMRAKAAVRWVVIHRWQRDSDKTVFVDMHRYATAAEAATVARQLRSR